MHTLEEDGQEVVQGNQEGVGPLAGEVRREGRVLLGGGYKRQNEPVSPLHLTLQLRRLLLEKLLGLLKVSFLGRRKDGVTVSAGRFLTVSKTGAPDFSARCYLDGVDDIVSVQTGPQFKDCGSVNVFQSAQKTSVQVQPVLLQTTEVKAHNKLLELLDDLIHLQTEDVLDQMQTSK